MVEVVVNWSQGLFRMWFVAALGWMIFYGVSQVTAVQCQMKIVWTSATTFETSAPAPEGSFCASPIANLSMHVQPLERHDPQLWLSLLGPPGATFLLGFVLIWIVRGFSRKPDR